MVTNYQKFGFIAGQTLSGFIFGLIACILTALIGQAIFSIFGVLVDLFPSVLYAILGGYIGMAFGVGIATYKGLSYFKKIQLFAKSIMQGTIAMVISLPILYYYLIRETFSETLSNVLVCTFPLIIMIVFSNLGVLNRLNG